MLLAIDVGNTHIVLGLYQDQDLLSSWRIQSDVHRTVDEYAMELSALLQISGRERKSVSAIIISSVVPALTRVVHKLSTKYFDLEPLLVGPGIKTGMKINCDDPRSVGSDRIVNAVATRELFGAPAVVVDFGTATTFDVVSASGDYEGGIIAPGLVISAEAMFARAAQLPAIELKSPSRLIGKNTHDSMLSGVIYGYASLVDGVIGRIRSEITGLNTVIFTGGLANLVAEECQTKSKVVGDLTLRGLRIIASWNL